MARRSYASGDEPAGVHAAAGHAGAAAAAECEAETVQALSHRISSARLLKRVFDFDMQLCPNSGAWEVKDIAAVVERPVIERILTHLGLEPAPKGRARAAGRD